RRRYLGQNATRSRARNVIAVSLELRCRRERLEYAADVVDLLAAAWRGAADVVEHPAVAQAVIRQPLDPAAAVEIDRDDALIDHGLRHERDRTLGALRNIIEDFAADGRNRRGRAHQDQDLL